MSIELVLFGTMVLDSVEGPLAGVDSIDGAVTYRMVTVIVLHVVHSCCSCVQMI